MLETESFIIPEKKFNRGSSIRRRNHIALSIKNFMLINGGLDYDDKFLADTSVLQYLTLKWDPLECKGVSLPPVAYHSCCLVIPTEKLEHKNFDLYRSNDIICIANPNSSSLV